MVMSGKRSGGILTKKILISILKNGERSLEELFRSEERQRVLRGVRGLKDRGYIGFREIDGKTELQLEKKGKVVALKYSLQDIEISREKVWDGVWRVICFDIPESKKSARNYFKSILDNLGFALLQKSVYVMPFECRKEIDFIIGILGISPYVTYIEANEIGITKKLKKKFNLTT